MRCVARSRKRRAEHREGNSLEPEKETILDLRVELTVAISGLYVPHRRLTDSVKTPDPIFVC